MSAWIVLLRGVNVGGRKLPMKNFAALLENLGGEDVRTYIQSGNAVFRHKARSAAGLAKKIAGAVADAHGFEPHVLALTPAQFRKAASDNPFPEAEQNHKSVHLYFLDSTPKKPDMAKLSALATKTEQFALKGAVFYLHTPDGYGISKLADGVEKALGVPATARNWRTVKAILEMTE